MQRPFRISAVVAIMKNNKKNEKIMPLMTPSVKSGAKVRRLSQLTKPGFALLQRLFFEGVKQLLFSEGCFPLRSGSTQKGDEDLRMRGFEDDSCFVFAAVGHPRQ